MGKILTLIFIVLLIWFALKVARFALRAIAIVVLIAVIVIAYFVFVR